MSSQLGPIDIECDAPPYPIVRAGRLVGMNEPEDVRWCRLSHFVGLRTGWKAVLNPKAWKLLINRLGSGQTTCSCGQALPELEEYTFIFRTGKELSYLMGQCGRCRTIFWEEP
jgi:hypothetical protein